jgi:plasmid stabilization system protein ParE
VKRLKVIIAPVVREQIRSQVLYIAQDSIDNALAWEDRLRAVMNSIGDMPGHAIDEDASDRLGEPIRKKVFEGTYLIHYRVNDAAATVEIVNFRHGMRLPRSGEP